MMMRRNCSRLSLIRLTSCQLLKRFIDSDTHSPKKKKKKGKSFETVIVDIFPIYTVLRCCRFLFITPQTVVSSAIFLSCGQWGRVLALYSHAVVVFSTAMRWRQSQPRKTVKYWRKLFPSFKCIKIQVTASIFSFSQNADRHLKKKKKSFSCFCAGTSIAQQDGWPV